MEGFFTKKETTSASFHNGRALSCVSCGRYVDCKNPKLEPSGKFEKKILNIFDFPELIEDRNGSGFIGKRAQYLERIYKSLNIDMNRDCLNTYATACYCEDNITGDQIANHRRKIMKLIETVKPSVIICFGASALLSLIGDRWKKNFGNIEKWRGWNIPDQDIMTWICPQMDLETAMESRDGVAEVILIQDLKKALSKIPEAVPVYKEPEIIVLESLEALDKISASEIAFDYETTGLKPHAPGHEIVCASVAISSDKVYTFMMPKTKKERKPFTNLLRSKSVRKIAQNMKFEDTWSAVRLRTEVRSWFFDTMIAAHIIDNRKGITGLKFQTYVILGVIDYDSAVSPYLSTNGHSDNEINRVLEFVKTDFGKSELLKYCALDSINEFRLAQKYKKNMLGTIGETDISPALSDFPQAYQLMHDGILALARAERNGMRIDTEYCERQKLILSEKIDSLEAQIKETKFYRHWMKSMGKAPNLNSGDQLGFFLYNIKKIEPAKFTDKGKGSTDEDALKGLKIPELDWILERSKLMKVRDTYLEAFVKEQVNGWLHPFFNLHLVKTYRSSSNSPNFQNIPNRDKQAMKIVRDAIFPRKGNQLMEMDFSGVEVGIAACHHKDPTMIKYLLDNTTDMHGDMAKQIFKIKNFDRHKESHSFLRKATKNGFVFPQFYGDYYKNNAISLCSKWTDLPLGNWKASDGILLEPGKYLGGHLIENGISNYTDFENHIRKIESHFWKVRFPVYARWKERTYKAYCESGYIPLKTGFVCKGLMSRNDVINYPVQGAAFHCLLMTFILVDRWLRENNKSTRIIGQIHDAIIFDVDPSELKDVHGAVMNIATKELAKIYKWINIPLSMETEICGVDESWANKKDLIF